MTCDTCRRRPAVFLTVDQPEQEGGLLFGDETLGRVLCQPCLTRSLQDGPWDHVLRLADVDAGRLAA